MGTATKNLMWEADGKRVHAGHRLVADCPTAALAKIVAREHNAHAALLEIAKEALSDATCNTWQDVIRDALALAEPSP